MATMVNLPARMQSEISKAHGDYLYEKSDYILALYKYMETIGHLNPSYVIDKFIEV